MASEDLGTSRSVPTDRGALPAARRPERATLLARIGRLWLAFFRGQLTLMLAVGAITWVGLTALGVHGALYLGVIAGLLEAIPHLGPIIALVPATIVALWYGSTYLPISPLLLAVLVIVFYVFVQQLENLLIVPRVMGDALKLPALVVLVGVAVGAWLGGVPGALLATPLIATGREILRYCRPKGHGEEPFPDEEAAP